MNAKEVFIVGYSGHAFVVYNSLLKMGLKVAGYIDMWPKEFNPFQLDYICDDDNIEKIRNLKSYEYFLAMGDNSIREKLYLKYSEIMEKAPMNVIHPGSIISIGVEMGNGIFISANACINPLSKIGNGVICNTGSIIEHDCQIGDFSHIAPGAVLCGNVIIGSNSFIGANSVVRQGIKIGNNVTIGAGSVIVKNIENSSVVVGNPQRRLWK